VGPASSWVDELGRLVEMGMDAFIFWPGGEDPVGQVEAFAAEVAPVVRAGGSGILLLALVVVVVGGLGSVGGALIAALTVGLLDEFGKWLFPTYALFTLYAPVALLLAWRPQGFFGKEGHA
jgi:branched-subunit amino acid ABC-type transport system permease component